VRGLVLRETFCPFCLDRLLLDIRDWRDRVLEGIFPNLKISVPWSQPFSIEGKMRERYDELMKRCFCRVDDDDDDDLGFWDANSRESVLVLRRESHQPGR